MRRTGRSIPARPIAVALTLLGCVGSVAAQQTSAPNPSRTAYKCVVGKSTVYSEAPCPGAERLELQPGRAVSKSSVKELDGANGRPLTGKSSQELEMVVRRSKLSPGAQTECTSLDTSIPRVEAEERATAGEAKAAVQRKLFPLRIRYRELGC